MTGVTINVALSLSLSAPSDPSPVSVAVKVIVSFPFQSSVGAVIVATWFVIETTRFVLPLYVQSISASAVSISLT